MSCFSLFVCTLSSTFEDEFESLTIFAQRSEVLRTTVAQESRQNRKTRASVKTWRVTARSSLVMDYILVETRRQVARFFVQYYSLDDSGKMFKSNRFLIRQYGGPINEKRNVIFITQFGLGRQKRLWLILSKFKIGDSIV